MVKHAKMHGKGLEWLITYDTIKDREIRCFGPDVLLEQSEIKILNTSERRKMKVTNISNQTIRVQLREKTPTYQDLLPGQSIEFDKIFNLNKIRRQIRIGENLTEVIPSGSVLNG